MTTANHSGVTGSSQRTPTGYDAGSRRRANHSLLDAIQAIWDEVPEQRFGQLIMNLSREPGGFADTWEWRHGEWYGRCDQAYKTWANPDGVAR